MMARRKIYSRRTFEDRVFDIINYILMIFLIIITLYPFINVIAVSLNDPLDSIKGGIYLKPRKPTLYNYRVVLSRKEIYNATGVSVLRTVVGTGLGILATFFVAYPLSRKDFVFRKPLTTYFLLTMYVSGGLIPGYFLIKSLGLLNNFWVYILPGLVSAFNILVVRSYISTLPDSFVESAKIDGAGEFRILFTIIMPLCIPVLATIALFIAVGQWNSWFDTYIYASSKQELSTLQFELQKILQEATQAFSTSSDYGSAISSGAAERSKTITPTSIRATMTVVATLPVLLVYPFLQKYFVTGLTLGGVKG